MDNMQNRERTQDLSLNDRITELIDNFSLSVNIRLLITITLIGCLVVLNLLAYSSFSGLFPQVFKASVILAALIAFAVNSQPMRE